MPIKYSLNGKFPLENLTPTSSNNVINFTSNSFIVECNPLPSTDDGPINIITQPTSDNSEKVATTAYVKNNLDNYCITNRADTSYLPINNTVLPQSSTINTPIDLSDSSDKIATTNFVTNKLDEYSLNVPSDNLNEYLTISSANATYVPRINPELTGNPRVNTPIDLSDSSDKIATTKYVTDKSSNLLTHNDTSSYVTLSSLSDYLPASQATTTYTSKNSPVFIGTPEAPTQESNDNSTLIATTKYVTNIVVDYLKRSLADITYVTKTGLSGYVTSSLAQSIYAPKESPILSGTPTAPTPTLSDNSNKLATSNYFKNNFATFVPTNININSSNDNDTICDIVFSSGTGSQTIKNTSRLSYDVSKKLLLRRTFNTSNVYQGGYYLNGCSPQCIIYMGSNTYSYTLTDTSTNPIYPYYTYDTKNMFNDFCTLNIILPNATIIYDGCKITFRKVNNTGGDRGYIKFSSINTRSYIGSPGPGSGYETTIQFGVNGSNSITMACIQRLGAGNINEYAWCINKPRT